MDTPHMSPTILFKPAPKKQKILFKSVQIKPPDLSTLVVKVPANSSVIPAPTATNELGSNNNARPVLPRSVRTPAPVLTSNNLESQESLEYITEMEIDHHFTTTELVQAQTETFYSIFNATMNNLNPIEKFHLVMKLTELCVLSNP